MERFLIGLITASCIREIEKYNAALKYCASGFPARTYSAVKAAQFLNTFDICNHGAEPVYSVGFQIA